MKGRSTLYLFICIVLAGAFIWLQENWREKNSGQQMERIRLFNLDINTLSSIEFSHSNGVVRCVKENGVWMAGDGDGNLGRADLALIQRMVSGLNSMGKGTTITSKNLAVRGLDEGEFGFDEPLVEIVAVDNQGRHIWKVGRNTPLGDMVYAKDYSRDDIYTIPNKLLVVVPGSHDLLRDRVLFPGDAASVRRIEIRGSAGFVQLVKDPLTGWHVQQPVSALADPKEIEGFIEKLYGFYIEDFVADNVSDFSVYGLQSETRQISIGGGDGLSRMLVIGGDIPDRVGYVYARRADDTTVFTLPADVLQLLNIPAQRFRDANVLPMPWITLSSIHIRKGDELLNLEMDESKNWTVKTPVVWNANIKAVSELAQFWGNAVITEFNMPSTDAAAEWVFEFGSADGGITNRIEVLPANGRKDGLVIRRSGEAGLFQINMPMVPDTMIDPLRFKDRQIWQLNKQDINKISLITNGSTQQALERQEDLSFTLVLTNGVFKADASTTDRLLNKLERIETPGYITYNPRDLDIYGLAQPAMELQVSLTNANELGRVLLIGRETPDGYYSMVKGRDVVFFLDKEFIEQLSTDLSIQQAPAGALVE